MIFCNLKGGLGNMMFQVAASLAMANRFNTTCSFPNIINHLKILNDDTYYNPKLKHSQDYLFLFKNLNNYKPESNLIPILNFPFHFQEPPKITFDCYINGFFQSEKYFINEKKIILDYFSIPDEFINFIKLKYLNLFKFKTTSIHVRRGDYLKLSEHHNNLDLNYYKKCMDILEDKTDLFVVFSDDIDWCKNNIKSNKILFIENEKDYIELYMMSLCNNNIIANSSFSWWGAYLNKSDTKIVISPNKKSWFGPAYSNWKTDDLFPESWIQV